MVRGGARTVGATGADARRFLEMATEYDPTPVGQRTAEKCVKWATTLVDAARVAVAVR
ncbi:MAG: hypothetical protein ISR43_06145 [Acidimicrobiia bacterium]|nr:hypothetical protein [Acidimicrobiia bacterium]